jgi:hypothetical protein
MPGMPVEMTHGNMDSVAHGMYACALEKRQRHAQKSNEYVCRHLPVAMRATTMIAHRNAAIRTPSRSRKPARPHTTNRVIPTLPGRGKC